MGEAARVWRAGMLVIGDEILSGRTQDRNVATLARWLNAQGIRLGEVRIVPDQMDAIGGALGALMAAHDYVFTTGGIGPTHDDITVDAVAAALGVPVVTHPRAEAILRAYYGERITEARLRMARVPEGAELIENPRTGAPGVRIGKLFLMAGVPSIMQAMLDALEGQLEGGAPLVSVAVGAWVPESQVAELLGALQKAHPDIAIGSYPFWREGRVGANFVLRGADPAAVTELSCKLRAELERAGIDSVEGEL
jgi:molybdenum cofactor synthesis domain-containing protein